MATKKGGYIICDLWKVVKVTKPDGSIVFEKDSAKPIKTGVKLSEHYMEVLNESAKGDAVNPKMYFPQEIQEEKPAKEKQKSVTQ
jgi:hypothetical protein